MTDDFKYDVFLSHSSKDKPVVRDIADRLKADGVQVWFDEWVIKPGDNIPAKIEQGLEHSRVLVLCMSADAFGSDWAQLEAGTFRFRDPLNKERRFIPLRFDNAPIKGSLAQFLYISWLPADREQEYPKLLTVSRSPAKQPVAEIQTAPLPDSKTVIKLKNMEFIRAYTFSRDGKRALTGDEGHKVRLWDLETGRCLRAFKGHSDEIWDLAWSIDERRALSSSNDKTLRFWDVETGRCLRVLEGHTDKIRGLDWRSDQSHAVSGSWDKTVRFWDVETGRCLRVLEGHQHSVMCVAMSKDHRCTLSGSADKTVRLWDVETGRCLRVLEGHTRVVHKVAWSTDQRLALSASEDKTVRLWDVETGRCLRVLEGHTGMVTMVAWSTDQRLALSGDFSGSIRLWDVETGRCLRQIEAYKHHLCGVVWSADQRRAFSCDTYGNILVSNLQEFVTEALTPEDPTPVVSAAKQALPPAPAQIQYTNAKVLIVGESGAGKTGLTERLAHDTFTHSYSTSGTWSTQWQMKGMPSDPCLDREVWLWDFGGQADQRLIHQLYADKTALILLVFNADNDLVLPGLLEWRQALSHCVPHTTPTYLIAGRIDVGFRFDRKKIHTFAQQSGYRYFETSALDGRNCPELRKAIQDGIPWTEMECRTSPMIFKILKDEILKLRDERQVLFTFKELRETLHKRLSTEVKFTDMDLETVVGLLDGPGVVKELNFGTFILLRPEWINVYAQAVIRTLRTDAKNLGCLPVQSIGAGMLIFQHRQASGEVVEENRLGAREEPIVLKAMEQMLIERKLCLQQEGSLVFPSYCGIEKPAGPLPARYFISYVFGGFIDDIYATLVVKLVYCGAFKLKELWRDAADFETLLDHQTMGIKLMRNEDGKGTLLVHFGRSVAPQEQVIFANYIHEHLLEKAIDTQRLRFYVCPHCDTTVKDSHEAMCRVSESLNPERGYFFGLV